MNNEEQLENKEQMKCQFDDEKYNTLSKEMRKMAIDIKSIKSMLMILFILSFIYFLWMFSLN